MIVALESSKTLGVRLSRDNRTQYLVAPVTLIVPGVLNGNRGPLLYLTEEFGKDVEQWNGIPLLLNHPFDEEGNPVPASTPHVVELYGLGEVRNAFISATGKLMAEAWFDARKTKKVSRKVYNLLKSRSKIEVSTGLGADRIPVENGEHNGRGYTHVVRNLVADHLAILPDTVGACSIRDGCGVFVNGALSPSGVLTLLVNSDGEVVDDSDSVDIANELVTNPYPNEHAARVADPGVFVKDSFRRKEIAPGVSMIMGKRNKSGPMVVQAYRFDKSKFTAEEARKWLKDHNVSVKSFEPASGKGSTTGNESTDTSSGGEDMSVKLNEGQKKQIIDGLTANCSCPVNTPWKGKDAAYLANLSDDTLSAYDEMRKALVENNNDNRRDEFIDALGNRHVYANGTWQTVPAPQPQPVVVNNNPAPAPAPSPAPAPAPQVPVVNAVPVATPVTPAKPKTLQEWLAVAPPEGAAIFNQLIEEQNRVKAELVASLVANVAEEMKESATAIYSGMEVPQLRVLASALPPKQEPQAAPVINFLGAGGAPQVRQPVVEEPLLPPVYNFGRAG